jgi:sporulation integral membrane protein YtvI
VLAVSIKKIIINVLTVAGIIAGLFLFPFVLKSFLPFVLAFWVASPCQRIVEWLEGKLHLNRGISSAIISIFIVAGAIFVLGFVVFQLYLQTKNLFATIPVAADLFRGSISRLEGKLDGFVNTLPEEISIVAQNMVMSFKGQAESISRRFAEGTFKFATDAASRLPGIVLFVTMFVLATFFFTKDYILVKNFINELLPPKVLTTLSKGKGFVSKAFSAYIRAQLVLMLLTSAIVTISLWVVGSPAPLLWGMVCGAVDALPFFGTAVVLVPWAVISFINGNQYMFFSLLIIQAIVFLVRQLAEPKIVSQHIGIHPILTLVSIYTGLKYFGVAGVIFAPIFMLLLANLYVLYDEKKHAEKFKANN